MSFIKSFCGIIGGATNRPASADYTSYGSNTDTLDEMLTPGYFNSLNEELYKNDKIWIFNNSDWADCRVTSENNVTPVTISAISSSKGAGTYYKIVNGPYSQYSSVKDAINDNQNNQVVIVIDGPTIDTGLIGLTSNVVIINFSQWTFNNLNLSYINADIGVQIYGYAGSKILIQNTSSGALFQGTSSNNTLKLYNSNFINTLQTNNVTLSSGAGLLTISYDGIWEELEETNGCGIHSQNANDYYQNLTFIANESETFDVCNIGNASVNKIKFVGPFSLDPAKPSLTSYAYSDVRNISLDQSVGNPTTTLVASLGGVISGVTNNVLFPQNFVISLQNYAKISKSVGATINCANYVTIDDSEGVFNTISSNSHYKINNSNHVGNGFAFNGSESVCSNLSCNGVFTFNATNSIAVACKPTSNFVLDQAASGTLTSCVYSGNILAGGANVHYSGGNNVQRI
jgi:hypothetical protein